MTSDAMGLMMQTVGGLWRGILQPMILWVDHACFRMPLRMLYFDGPELGGYGFWGGRPPEDVCAEMSGLSSRAALLNPDGCTELLERRFAAFLLCARLILLLYAVYKTWNVLTVYYTVMRPMRIAQAQARHEMLVILDQLTQRGALTRGASPRRRAHHRPSSVSLSSLGSSRSGSTPPGSPG